MIMFPFNLVLYGKNSNRMANGLTGQLLIAFRHAISAFGYFSQGP
jgi:hypothetical protein